MLENSLYFDLKPYQFNELFNKVRTIFKDFTKVQSYFEEWHQLIMEQEKYINNDYMRYLTRRLKYPKDRYEVFDINLLILNIQQPYYINFDVEVFKQVTQKVKYSKASITKTLKALYWNRPDKKSDYPLSKEPIISVLNPFLNPEALLIDGNHRLAYYLDNHIRKVRYVYFTNPGPDCFIFKIDYVMYYYIKNINQCRLNSCNFSDLEIVKEKLLNFNRMLLKQD